VDERQPSPKRSPRRDLVELAIELACREGADGVIVLCDADDDCAAFWGPQASTLVAARCRGGAVMIVREYEAWLLTARLDSPKHGSALVERIRDAKGVLKKLVPGYKPTTHQLELTRAIDIERLRMHSDSFDKFVRALASIFEKPAPVRRVDGPERRSRTQAKTHGALGKAAA